MPTPFEVIEDLRDDASGPETVAALQILQENFDRDISPMNPAERQRLQRSVIMKMEILRNQGLVRELSNLEIRLARLNRGVAEQVGAEIVDPALRGAGVIARTTYEQWQKFTKEHPMAGSVAALPVLGIAAYGIYRVGKWFANHKNTFKAILTLGLLGGAGFLGYKYFTGEKKKENEEAEAIVPEQPTGEAGAAA